MLVFRRTSVFALILICFAAVTVTYVVEVKASPTTWIIETVDAALDVGHYCSIALDSDDSPHISYHDYHWQNLKYATISLIMPGPKWAITQIDAIQMVGEFTSLALDSNDRPHISYYDEGYDDLKYTRWTGSTWAIETVDASGDVGYYTSLALDSNDRPHISYLDVINDDLKYSRWTGSAWNIETVDSIGMLGYITSLAVDSNNHPHISYHDRTNSDLKYARWMGSAWAIETVDSTGNIGSYSSIVVDSTDNPHISYYDETNGDLKYAKWTGSTWNIEIVDSTGNVGLDNSLALDSSSKPHISYRDYTNEDLKYARWTGSAWSIETVDSTGDVGSSSSLALDSEDRPHISYYDFTNKNLKYATTSDEYFATISVTPFDSDSDGNNDAVRARMDVDTTYSGTVPIQVNAILFDPFGFHAALNSSSWSIIGQVVDWMHPNATVTLYVPAGYAEGPALYMLMLNLFDDDGLLEDSYQEINIHLYPSSTVTPAASIESCNIIGERQNTFDLGEIVFVNGSGYSPFTEYDCYVVWDQITWMDGMILPERVPETEPAIFSDAYGNIVPTSVWHNPQTVGNYDIVIDVNDNGQYDAGVDALDDGDVEVTAGLSIVPEFSTLLPFFILLLSLSAILLRKHAHLQRVSI
ncbi:MAG: hypothetical protein PVF96_07690 [Candidatus Bathyarchaeota archaeon]